VDIPSLLSVDKSRINCIHDDVNDTTYLFIGIDVNTFEIIDLGTDELIYFNSEYLDGIKCDKSGYYVMGENVVMLCMFDGRTLKLKSTKALVDYVLKRNRESNHAFVNTGKLQWLHGMRKEASLMEKVEGNKFARLRRKTKDIDGETIDARQTLVCVCNGRHYGGGFNPVPDADPADGLLDVLVVKAVSRLQLAKVIGKYKAGGYKDLPNLIRHFKAKTVKVLCDKVTPINLDGELRMAKEVVLTVAQEKIRFFYPKGLTWQVAELAMMK
jgi:hypothetical protein